MSDWKQSWREALRMLETHAHPDLVEWHLSLMLAEHPEFGQWCPHCEVAAGPCVSPSGREAETHSMRLTRAGVSS